MKRSLFAVLLFGLFVGSCLAWRYSFQQSGEKGEIARTPAAREEPARTGEAVLTAAAEAASDSSKERSNAKSELLRDSKNPWVLRDRGSSTTLAGGVLPTGRADPLEASQHVLRNYGAVFHLSSESSALTALNREEGGSQVIYQQLLNGEPVFGSRINMFFNERGELVHLAADTYRGPIPAHENDVGLEIAVARLRAELHRFLSRRGPAPTQDSYGADVLGPVGVRGYRLVGERVSRVYHFQFPLIAPHTGDIEAFVDARDGTVAVLREISRQ